MVFEIMGGEIASTPPPFLEGVGTKYLVQVGLITRGKGNPSVFSGRSVVLVFFIVSST